MSNPTPNAAHLAHAQVGDVCPVCYHHALITTDDVDFMLRNMHGTSDPHRLQRIAMALHQGIRESAHA